MEPKFKRMVVVTVKQVGVIITVLRVVSQEEDWPTPMGSGLLISGM